MADRRVRSEQNETPEDVATLYSWANLHGAKYRDFSASRALMREQARQRALEAAEEEKARERQDAKGEEYAAARRVTEEARAAEAARQAEEAARLAAQEDADRIAREAMEKAARQAELDAKAAAEEAACQAELIAQAEARRAAEAAEKEAADRAAREAEAARQEAARQAELAAQAEAERAAEQAAKEEAERAALQAQAIAEARRAAELAAKEEADRVARQAELAAQAEARRVAEQMAREEAERVARQAELAAQAEARRAAEQIAREEAERLARQAELVARAEARRAAEQAAREEAERVARQEAARQAELMAQSEARRAAEQAEREATELAARRAEFAAQQRAWQQPDADRRGSFAAGNPTQPEQEYGVSQRHRSVPVQLPASAPAQPASAAARPEPHLPHRGAWSQPEPAETQGRPAWLAQERPEPAPRMTPQAPADTLQGARDRMTSRWFALRGVFEGDATPPQETPAPVALRVPVTAVFSLAGGVGKTSIVATLGRALSARGERVLLVDTAAYGLLPFFFGARDQRPGMLRTFNSPDLSGDAPVQMITIDPETLGPENAPQEALAAEVAKYSRGGVSRVIVDLATASGATTRRVIRMSPLVLVPVVPDMNSVVSVSSIDGFFQRGSSAAGNNVLPFYVLNQFDPTLPLHLDVREVLREQLGDRLLPFAIRRAPAMSEALAEGMTVMDYAPESPVAEDFGSLAGWVKSFSAQANTGLRGVRWRER